MGNAFNQFGEGYLQGNAMAQGLATQRAGAAMGSGDSAGASNALYRSGQIDAGAAVQKQQADDAAERLKWMGQAADALSKVPDDGTQQARRAALTQHVLPTLRAMGVPDSSLQAIANGDLSDQSLAIFKSHVAHQYQLIQRRDGSVVAVDPQSLQQQTVLEPLPAAQQAQQHIPFGWEVDENGDAHPTQSFVRGKAQLAGATRAPARGHAGGGGGSHPGFNGLPPGYRPK